ncbi:MAG TPA: hypothetical protein VFZ91_03255 [Allosphingosinicella sp.]
MAYALRQLGSTYELVFNHTLAGGGGFRLRLGELENGLSFAPKHATPDTIWFRRFTRINIPDWVHPLDRRNAEGEWDAVLRSLRQLSRGRGSPFCVNPPEEAFGAGLKPVQLAAASRVGLTIPETLVSNSKAEVLAFEKDVGQIIYKSLISPGWVLPGDVDTWIPTTPIKAQDLPESSLQACPGIFQAYVPKAFEARVTVMGHEIFAVAIDSQSDPKTQVDWKGRGGSTRGMLRGRIEPPPEVRSNILALMRELKIIFGCLDFVIRPDGEWVFLEVNPQGQFLWVEREDESFPLLDAFTRFLLSNDDHFTYEPPDKPISLCQMARAPADQAWIEANRAIPPYIDPYIAFEEPTQTEPGRSEALGMERT